MLWSERRQNRQYIEWWMLAHTHTHVSIRPIHVYVCTCIYQPNVIYCHGAGTFFPHNILGSMPYMLCTAHTHTKYAIEISHIKYTYFGFRQGRDRHKNQQEMLDVPSTSPKRKQSNKMIVWCDLESNRDASHSFLTEINYIFWLCRIAILKE